MAPCPIGCIVHSPGARNELRNLTPQSPAIPNGPAALLIILDDRLLTKRYGRDLLDALPPMPVASGRWGELKGQVRDFYNRE